MEGGDVDVNTTLGERVYVSGSGGAHRGARRGGGAGGARHGPGLAQGGTPRPLPRGLDRRQQRRGLPGAACPAEAPKKAHAPAELSV